VLSLSKHCCHWKHRHFCPTGVYPERLLQAASRRGGSVSARWDDEIEVQLGTLDEPSRFTPTYESWTVRREDWLPEFAGMRGF
jgi:hypothetical protein